VKEEGNKPANNDDESEVVEVVEKPNSERPGVPSASSASGSRRTRDRDSTALWVLVSTKFDGSLWCNG
jgi:hypothetical protein